MLIIIPAVSNKTASNIKTHILQNRRDRGLQLLRTYKVQQRIRHYHSHRNILPLSSLSLSCSGLESRRETIAGLNI